ncbi:glycosyltransferase family 2 protein [Cognatiluteimonas telluris]|jgi:glycosyltransferase involved in cell wall biosynthesis|uniref:glycosyltransferase family 2 protein n=1 Tax=Cognatiluteimonas telluris TaxID=1104775 RepID=UPI001408595F|nr:glycosyltransferase family 2 protein [Lysobacter telluris]
MTVRNEALYLRRCLSHLLEQGIDVCVIDNDSSDGSADIVREFAGRGIFLERYPYPGYFDLEGILRNEERLARTLDADWFMHYDADEIREAPEPFASLREAIEAADLEGFNAINFDEFLFFPTSCDERYEGTDYVAAMRRYYFFAPRENRQVKLWKRTGSPVDLVSTGGHAAVFEGRKIHPSPFILRHYVALSYSHAVEKYTRQRSYSQREVSELGWHGVRSRVRTAVDIVLPPADRMHTLVGRQFDRSRPEPKHLFFATPKAAGSP